MDVHPPFTILLIGLHETLKYLWIIKSYVYWFWYQAYNKSQISSRIINQESKWHSLLIFNLFMRIKSIHVFTVSTIFIIIILLNWKSCLYLSKIKKLNSSKYFLRKKYYSKDENKVQKIKWKCQNMRNKNRWWVQ